MTLTIAVILARLVLAAVFGVAAVAKASDHSRSSTALEDFGVPVWLAPTVGWLLPLAEGTVAVALIPASTAWAGGICALFLLGVFLVGITYNVARGRTPDCRCFGQLRPQPVGWSTLVRNAVLAALAVLVVSIGPRRPQPDMVAWATGLTTARIALLVVDAVIVAVMAIGVWFGAHLFAQHGRILARLVAVEQELAHRSVHPQSASQPALRESAAAVAAAPQGLPLGVPAPSFSLPDLNGHLMSLASLLGGTKSILLLFVDPGCGPCKTLVPEAVDWMREHAERFQLVLVSRGSAKDNRLKFASTGLGPVLLENKYEVSSLYSAFGTPSAVLVRPDGRVGSAIAGGADAIRVLVSSVSRAPQMSKSSTSSNADAVEVKAPTATSRTATATVGAAAPTVRLTDIAGRTRTLREFAGRDTIVLFWNPSCGYCTRMLDEVRQLEESAGPESPQLVLVSTGDVEANRALGLSSPILLDPAFAVAPTFGVHGTPAAVMVDADGRIASAPALGAQQVLALAGPTEAVSLS
jgi:peroxiredoxin